MLNILYANVNSYIPKKHLINYVMEDRNTNCAMFVETKTKPESITDYKDWTIIKKNGNITNQNVRGGSLIQAAPYLKIQKANAPAVNNPLNEITHFAVPFQDDFLHVFLCYIHPTSIIEETLFTKAALYRYAIIIGDLNVNPTKTSQIQTFLKNSSFIQANTPPTFIMANNPDSTPDIILYTKNIQNNISYIDTVPDIGSDHLGFEIKIDTKAPTNEEIHYKINISKCNIQSVNSRMRRFLHQNKNQPMCENYITEFNNELSRAILEETPKSKQREYLTELPPYIIRLIKTKRKMYREYLRDKNPEFKRHLNMYNKNIQAMIRQFREYLWCKTCSNIEKLKGRNYWHEIKKVSRYKTKTSIPPIEINGSLTNDDQMKADAFGRYYESIYEFNNNYNYDQDNLNMITHWFNQFFSELEEEDEEVEPITEENYYRIINTGKSTSPGYDLMTKGLLRQLNNEVHKEIIKILNYCLQTRRFPEVWKIGQITTIPKPNADHSQVSNYRPITLLSVLGKILEIVIKERLSNHLNMHIPIYQFGFKEKHSTILPVTILTSNVQAAKLKGQHSATVFLDISKAFDSVWHNGLLYKLWRLGCPRHLLYLTKNYLINRKLQVKVGQSISHTFEPAQGVPQGSPLSPFLYNIFCFDLYSYFQPQLNYIDNKSYILQFADDTALITHEKTLRRTIQALQQLIENTEKWFKLWRLTVNPQKSHFLIFNHKIKPSSPCIVVSNHPIKPENWAKYLGITIDKKLNFNLHSRTVKNKCIARAKHFRNLTYKRQGISTWTACHIYQSICRPLLEYCHPIYINCRQPALNNIETAERNSLRSLTRIRHPRNPLHNPSNELLYQATGIVPIRTRLRQLSTKFANKQENINSLTALCHATPLLNRHRRYPQRTLLEELQQL